MARIRFERPAALHPHPLLKRVGMMEGLATHFQVRARRAGKNREDHRERAEELEGDWQALVASVAEKGVLEPIKICRIPEGDENGKPLSARWWIVDGRNRWLAATHAKLRHVPVMRVRAEDAPAIIAATVAARRHYTKGATAYLACLLHPEFPLEGAKREKAGEPSALSAKGLAAKFAVSPRLMEQAAKLYRLVEKHPHLRETAEADVWAGYGLGGVIAGVESRVAAGEEPERPAADRAAANAWATVRAFAAEHKKLAERWSHLSAEQRAEAGEMIRQAAAALPGEVKSMLKNLE